jgi:hypothetical protein
VRGSKERAENLMIAQLRAEAAILGATVPRSER